MPRLLAFARAKVSEQLWKQCRDFLVSLSIVSYLYSRFLQCRLTRLIPLLTLMLFVLAKRYDAQHLDLDNLFGTMCSIVGGMKSKVARLESQAKVRYYLNWLLEYWMAPMEDFLEKYVCVWGARRTVLKRTFKDSRLEIYTTKFNVYTLWNNLWCITISLRLTNNI